MQVSTWTKPIAEGLAAIGRRAYVRGHRRLVQRLFPAHDQRGVRFERPFQGYVYPGRLDSYVDWMVYFFGAYERYLLEYLVRTTPDLARGSVLDVGANVGHHSLYFAAHAAEVHSFEPYPLLHGAIREKMARNPVLAGRWTLHPFGLSDEDAELTFYPPGPENQGLGSFVHAATDAPVAPLRLEVRAGDALVESVLAQPLKLVKIDVEGFEMQVLRGLRQTIAHWRPTVVVEIAELNRDHFKTLAGLMSHLPEGYQPTVLQHTRGLLFDYRPVPLDERGYQQVFGNVICRPS